MSAASVMVSYCAKVESIEFFPKKTQTFYLKIFRKYAMCTSVYSFFYEVLAFLVASAYGLYLLKITLCTQ